MLPGPAQLGAPQLDLSDIRTALDTLVVSYTVRAARRDGSAVCLACRCDLSTCAGCLRRTLDTLLDNKGRFREQKKVNILISYSSWENGMLAF